MGGRRRYLLLHQLAHLTKRVAAGHLHKPGGALSLHHDAQYFWRARRREAARGVTSANDPRCRRTRRPEQGGRPQRAATQSFHDCGAGGCGVERGVEELRPLALTLISALSQHKWTLHPLAEGSSFEESVESAAQPFLRRINPPFLP